MHYRSTSANPIWDYRARSINYCTKFVAYRQHRFSSYTKARNLYIFHASESHGTIITDAKTSFHRTVALIISLVFATLLLIYLVEQIEAVVESGVPDQFLGLILLPLVEKAAEHLTAIDEAYDGVINVALYHCLGPSIQTALFNGPLVVIVGWILHKPMDLNFEIFMIVLVVLGILVVGNFLRDGESNWLEGVLLVVSVYTSSSWHTLLVGLSDENYLRNRLCM